VPRWVTRFHQVEVCPCGQRACSVSKSMVNPARSYPVPALAWRDWSASSGVTSVTPHRRRGVTEQRR